MRASTRSFQREMASFYKILLSLKILMFYVEIGVNLMETSTSRRLYIQTKISSSILFVYRKMLHQYMSSRYTYAVLSSCTKGFFVISIVSNFCRSQNSADGKAIVDQLSFLNLLNSDFEILRLGDTIVTLLTLVTVIL